MLLSRCLLEDCRLFPTVCGWLVLFGTPSGGDGWKQKLISIWQESRLRRRHCQAELYFSDILIRSHSDIRTGEFLVPGNDILMLTAGLLGKHFGASLSSGCGTWELKMKKCQWWCREQEVMGGNQWVRKILPFLLSCVNVCPWLLSSFLVSAS